MFILVFSMEITLLTAISKVLFFGIGNVLYELQYHSQFDWEFVD